MDFPGDRGSEREKGRGGREDRPLGMGMSSMKCGGEAMKGGRATKGFPAHHVLMH